MADVVDLFFLPFEEEQEVDFGSETLDSDPFSSSSSFEDDDEIPIQPVSSPPFHLSFDLFYHCPHPETLYTSNFKALDEIEIGAADYLGLGLGLGFYVQEEDQEEEGIEDRLRIIGFETGTELEVGLDPIDQDPGLRLCWDSLRLEEERRDFADDFDWEEVVGLLDEREFPSMIIGERSRGSDDGEDQVEESRNVIMQCAQFARMGFRWRRR